MGEGLSPTWTDETPCAETVGLNLRVAHAEHHGVAVARSRSILALIGQLEKHEYDDASETRLSEPARLDLWRHRTALAGATGAAGLTPEQTEAILNYWRWLLAWHGADTRPDDVRRLLRGDVVRAVVTDPAGLELAEAAWQRQGDAVGALPHAVGRLASVRSLLREAASGTGEPALERSYDAALLLAELSGFPASLIDRHRENRSAERALLSAALSAANARQLRTAGLAHFHTEGGRASDEHELTAPSLAVAPDGSLQLNLAEAELNRIEQVDARSLIEAVELLRRGSGPEKLVYKTASGMWRERLARGHHGAPDEEPNAAVASPAVGAMMRAARVGGRMPRAGDVLSSVRAALLLELESVYRAMLFDLAIGDARAVFPVDLYGARLSAEFGQDHILAAHNCLRALCSTAGVSRTGEIVISPQREGQREITLHMARTAPGMWGGEGNGRQLRRGFAGAVACVAQSALARMNFEDVGKDVQSVAGQFRAALGQFCAVAVLDGLGAMLLRYRLTSAALRSTEPQTAQWHDQLRTTFARMDSSLRVLLAQPDTAVLVGASRLAPDLQVLVERMDMLTDQGSDVGLARLVVHVRGMVDAIRALPTAARG